ncbi:hypothetical protein AB6A40_005330 [Gnathostoma spinigerum]|uniref:WH1 domain-containing protein n=1 Tax=Gnathostoma spinigerum TaxID=75299 RepID=A0ABD6EFZ9_9BILA
MESQLAVAVADVMIYDDMTKKWVAPDGGIEPARSQVSILRNVHSNTFRVVGTRLQNHEWIMNCKIHQRLKYNPATPTFHQWRDEQRKVHGLNFASEEDARTFMNAMHQAIAILSTPNEFLNGDADGSHAVYQEPQHLHHNAHSAPSFRDNDQDSISSGFVPNNNAQSYRKSSHSVASNSGASLMLSSQQRRCSQGSSSSSTNSTGAATIYASNPVCGTNSPSRTSSVPNGVVNMPQLTTLANSNPPPCPTPSSGIAPINVNAPPAPPPPPVSALKSRSGSVSIAEQLKNVQLRKISVPATANSANRVELNTASSVVSNRTHVNLFSELEATLNKRKNLSENVDLKNSGETIISTVGGSRKPWEKQSNTLNGTVTCESPKAHRNIGRAPSGSSLSSQEEQRSAASVTVNGHTAPPIASSNIVTVELLDKWKQELMNEIRLEINNAKVEIMELIRSQLQKR